MNPLQNVWRGLVQRRLLPVAILLVAALAAIPFVLKKDPQPVAPAPAPIAGGENVTADAAAEKPIVSLVGEGERTKRRRVLGGRKDPFAPAPAPKAAKAKSTAPAVAPATTETKVGGGGSGSGSTEGTKETTITGGTGAPSGSPLETPVVGGPAPAPKPKYELYSLTVRFGSSEGADLPKSNLPRLKALPSADNPMLVYLGLTKDRKAAIFMVDASLTPQGDGVCVPSESNCETIELRQGETEFFDVKDENGEVTAQYQLDLVKIKRSTTGSAAKAAAARAKVSKAGVSILRAYKADVGPLRYRYDAKTGTLRKLSPRAYKALVAKTAKVALAFSGGL